MDETPGSLDTINTLWLKNIYENLKNLENYERLARNGCTTTDAYATLLTEFSPSEVNHRMNDIQFKNLKNIVGEMHLLLTDLTPVLDKKLLEKIHESLDNIQMNIRKKSSFIVEAYSTPRNRIMNSELTDIFYKTLDILAQMRRLIIKDIEHILFIHEVEDKNTTKYYAE